MKQILLWLLQLFLGAIVGSAASNKFEDAIEILAHAHELETLQISDDARVSRLGASFSILNNSPDPKQQFQTLISSAATPAAKAYGILGLYNRDPDNALHVASSLPVDFRIKYLWYCLGGEWTRDEFIRELKKGDLFLAVSQPAQTTEPSSQKSHKNRK